jgi:hypothetical protein
LMTMVFRGVSSVVLDGIGLVVLPWMSFEFD